MKRRKLIVMFLSLIFVAALCGCGDEGEDTTVTFDANSPYTAELPSSVTTQTGVSNENNTDDSPSEGTSDDESTELIGTVANLTSSVNVRAEASTDGEIIGYAELGDQFVVLGTYADGEWYGIQYSDDTVGYIYADYLEVTEGTLTSDTDTDSDSDSDSGTDSDSD